MQEITIDEISRVSFNDYILIDIRTKIAYEHGHILDAISFPEPFDLKQLEELIRKFNKRTVIIYCTIGEKSREYVAQLNSIGIDAYNLQGGYKAWLLRCEKDLSKEEKLQYSRQMILPELGLSGQQKLKNAKVLVIGAGALGTVALTYLAAAGIGCLGIAEGDIIDASNLHRQILYERDDVGKEKIKVAKERLKKLNPLIKIQTHDVFLTPKNITETINGYDFIVDATDHIETKFLINDACVLAGIPFCHAGVVAFEGQVMSWIPGGYPCYRCIFEDVPDDYIPNCSEAGIIGAMSGIIGSVQALEAIKYITGIGDLLLGRMFHFDGKYMRTRIINLPKKNERCMVCGDDSVILDVSMCENRYAYRGC